MQTGSVVLNLTVEIHDNNSSKPQNFHLHLPKRCPSPSAMESRDADDADDYDEEQQQSRHAGTRQQQEQHQQEQQQPNTRPWYTARTILGAFSIVLSLALLGLGVKMSVAYDEVPLIHVSFAFVGFTVSFHTLFFPYQNGKLEEGKGSKTDQSRIVSFLRLRHP